MRYFRTNNIRNNKTEATNKAITSDQSEILRLVERAAKHDIEAFGELYSIYLAPIYRYVFYQVRDQMMAEDITEEVFIKAWKAIASCKGKEKTFSSWLYRIAHNHIIDNIRRRKKRMSVEMETVVEVADTKFEVEREVEQQELLAMVADLPERQRQVIILKFFEGLSNDEIAKIMNKSQGAVRVMQMRALAKLRQELTA